jgi:hypothetical protein
MAHFALLDNNNRVVQVLVGRDDDDGKEAELTARTGQQYRQTSYNTRAGVHYNPNTSESSADQSKAFRKNYAGIGYLYDPIRDAFIPPKPYASWVLDESTCLWKAPVDMPEDAGTGDPPKVYQWDETTTNWIVVE